MAASIINIPEANIGGDEMHGHIDIMAKASAVMLVAVGVLTHK